MAKSFRTNLTDETAMIRMPIGTRVRISGFRTPAIVYWYRRNHETGAVQACARFERIDPSEMVTWEGMPGPVVWHGDCQHIRRLVAKGAEVSHPTAKVGEVTATYE